MALGYTITALISNYKWTANSWTQNAEFEMMVCTVYAQLALLHRPHLQKSLARFLCTREGVTGMRHSKGGGAGIPLSHPALPWLQHFLHGNPWM